MIVWHALAKGFEMNPDVFGDYRVTLISGHVNHADADSSKGQNGVSKKEGGGSMEVIRQQC